MQITKQPLIVIEEKDCEACQGKGSFDIDTPCFCENGKSPTTLIFNAEDFCKNPKRYIKEEDCHCFCCGTHDLSILLPKKGEYYYTMYEYGEPKAEGRTFHCFAKSDEEAKEQFPYQKWGMTMQKFRLTSDAALRSAREYIREQKGIEKQGVLIIDFADDNLFPSSKIVEIEGYYEM